MFNGTNLDGWTTKIHHYESGDNFGDTFRAEDDMIKVRYDKYEGDFNDRFGHLYFDSPYSYFHLSMEYRFVGELHPGAPSYALLNSGVMFHSQDPRTMLKEQNWPISVEMQFLAGIEQGVDRPTGNMCSPGTEIVFQGAAPFPGKRDRGGEPFPGGGRDGETGVALPAQAKPCIMRGIFHENGGVAGPGHFVHVVHVGGVHA